MGMTVELFLWPIFLSGRDDFNFGSVRRIIPWVFGNFYLWFIVEEINPEGNSYQTLQLGLLLTDFWLLLYVHAHFSGWGLDKKIGKSFLVAGIGFGGFCFPKDLQAFIHISEKNGYDFGLLREAKNINDQRISRVIGKVREALWILKGKTIGVLGLAFKPR